jgi:hypothetical protein
MTVPLLVNNGLHYQYNALALPKLQEQKIPSAIIDSIYKQKDFFHG